MTHELKNIVEAYQKAEKQGRKCVLATVVALEGSSYRRPGVRMLIWEDGTMIGAVSGGCVEKEVYRQALSVFDKDMPKVMSYDGRYRLGCEGVLYILLEPFRPSKETVNAFWEAVEERIPYHVTSYYVKEFKEEEHFGSVLRFGRQDYPFRKSYTIPETSEYYEQKLHPCFQLILIGAEHDAVQTGTMASLLGWEVTVVVPPNEEKTKSDFPGIHKFLPLEAEQFNEKLDNQTAVLLMTHSYVKDLQFLKQLKDSKPAYFGILGPLRRREKLFNELFEHCPDISMEFIESIYGPAGL